MNLNKFQKISISFFLGVFLFSAFYFLFSDIVLAGGATRSWEEKPANINIACEKYQYPWCEAAKSGGIAPLVSQFYKIALGLAGASALGVLIYGSILWTLSGAVSSKQDAKEWISGALWGLALLLGAYLILNTINPQLTILKEPSITAVSVPAPTKSTIGALPPELAGFSLSHQKAQIEVDAAGIKLWSSSGRIGPQTEGSTSLEGVKTDTINGVIAFKGACIASTGTPCDITITGGTEPGHEPGSYSHSNGYKLDIDPNPQVNNYIMNSSRFEKLPPRGTDLVYRDKLTGYVYVYEKYGQAKGSHWDVTFAK